MSQIDYSIFYKKSLLDVNGLREHDYDLFISAFNDSQRVTKVFDLINAKKKHWLILPEYKYENHEIPDDENTFKFSFGLTESEIIMDYFNRNGIIKLNEKKICIDITGFIRPHLIFLIKYLYIYSFGKVDFIYTDPDKYINKEQTNFSYNFKEQRQVNGCEGNHNADMNNDFLIIGAGYDNKRINDVAKHKSNATKVQLFGFPSLQADMYQENILKAYKAIENSAAKGDNSFLEEDYVIYAPANDPFITAQQLQGFIKKEQSKKSITNLYLCPLSTKAQTLGFALYYIAECQDSSASIIFPFSSEYNRETTEGLARIWIYTVEFDAFT